MGYEKWYNHTSIDSPSSSILEFFGFHMTVKDGERLRAHTVSEWKKVDDNTIVKEKRAIGFYTEKNGLKDCRLERSYVSEENKALEERFIESVRKEGKEPTSNYFIWNTSCPAKSVESFAHVSTASVVWPIIFGVIAGLAALAFLASGVYQYWLAYQANASTDEAIGKIHLAILAGVVIVPLVYTFFAKIFVNPCANAAKRSRRRHESSI